MDLRVRMLNQASIMLSQEAPVGVNRSRAPHCQLDTDLTRVDLAVAPFAIAAPGGTPLGSPARSLEGVSESGGRILRTDRGWSTARSAA